MSTIREMNHITCPQTVILDLHEFSSQNIYNVQKKGRGLLTNLQIKM